ncbi:hypothetical protein RIF29_40589 [Crotalaria pallida]|uniref:Transmembrane protein n=1 Tax=Crotalaria pallida TaxID=3830 RepID=A0AAN9E8U3_CROPI
MSIVSDSYLWFADKEDYICSNDDHKSEKKQPPKKHISALRGRRPRTGFSDSFSTIGIISLLISFSSINLLLSLIFLILLRYWFV